MPKLSKNALSIEVQKKLEDYLVQSLRLLNESGLRLFLKDLLTPMEQKMLAKRVMAALLLQRGHAPQAICSLLKMSKDTVNSISNEIQKSGVGFKLIHKKFLANNQSVDLKLKSDTAPSSLSKFINVLNLPRKGSRKDMARWRRALYEL
ncbi:MAG: hypothetical protein HY220_01200 [Candidatus Sungbacteria bacterium]|uniref:TrpR like protein, YerC/YecD n=1 Tax=Candidatus Sungiibacteriota bacterium TaxID=2750080 RepID=A0A9D6QTW3_9BACT|nr:hypothetical protein [Candidatus Sungbacteria bacterium]